MGIAKGSNQELLEDYQDYLKQHGLNNWAGTQKQIIAQQEQEIAALKARIAWLLGNQECSSLILFRRCLFA